MTFISGGFSGCFFPLLPTVPNVQPQLSLELQLLFCTLVMSSHV